jgi:hypothetical protein
MVPPLGRTSYGLPDEDERKLRAPTLLEGRRGDPEPTYHPETDDISHTIISHEFIILLE